MGDEPLSGRLLASCIGHQGCQCVVLVHGGRSRPQTLLDGLTGRGANPLVVKEPVQVMAELACHPHSVMIVDRPEAVHKLPQLLAAVQRYYPRVACWGYGAGRPGEAFKLSRITHQETAATKQPASLEPTRTDRRFRQPASDNHHPAVERNDAEPIDGHPGSGDSDQPIGADTMRLPDPLVTQDELSMLMGLDSDVDVVGQAGQKWYGV